MPKTDFILPTVRLPQEMCHCMMLSNLGLPQTMEKVFGLLQADKSFLPMVEKTFPEFKKEGRIGLGIKSLGWVSLRNKLCSLYVQRCYGPGQYEKYDETLIEDVIRFEQKFAPYGLLGQSRIFLLGLYLKMARIKYPSGGSEVITQMPQNDLKEILERHRARSERPDFLVIFLWSMLTYMNRDQIIEVIEKNRLTPFKNLWSPLQPEQKNRVIKNLLRYGFSINDPGWFFQKVVWES